MADRRKQESNKIRRFAQSRHSKGLLEGLFFQDDAIKYLLKTNSFEGNNLKKSLIAIINGEDPLAKLHQGSVNECVDSVPPSVNQGFLPMAVKASANMDYQISAINYLKPFIDVDDSIYTVIWDAANGKKSNMTNVADAAIFALAGNNPKRKQGLKKIAVDPQMDQYVRWKAYTVLAFFDLTKDKNIYDLVCDIADDHSISDLYAQQKIMSPNAKFWYAHEVSMRKQYAHRKDGKTDDEIKDFVVQKVQKEFQEGILEVMKYLLYNRSMSGNEFLYPFIHGEDDSRRFERFDSSRLTSQLCDVVKKNQNHQVFVLCQYIRKLQHLPSAEVIQVIDVLKNLRTDSFAYFSYKKDIEHTLHDVEYRLKQKD